MLGMCADCNKQCLRCNVTASNCVDCLEGGPFPLLFNATCIEECPDGMHRENGTCLPDQPSTSAAPFPTSISASLSGSFSHSQSLTSSKSGSFSPSRAPELPSSSPSQSRSPSGSNSQGQSSTPLAPSRSMRLMPPDPAAYSPLPPSPSRSSHHIPSPIPSDSGIGVVIIPARPPTSRTIQAVDIKLEDGSVVGRLEIPEGVTGKDPREDDYSFAVRASTANDLDRNVRGGRQLSSAIADITLQSPTLGSLSQLAKPLKICLQGDQNKEYCLSFRNDPSEEWKCEDQCLDEEEGNSYCGYTDHLTSFALLLGRGVRSCDDEKDRLYIWLSIGFITGAIILVVAVVISLEIYLRVASKRRSNFLRQIGSQ